jgi:hypothetical protein
MVAPLAVVAKLEAEFLKLAVEVIVGCIEVGVAACGEFVGQLVKAERDSVVIGDGLHDLNPFS